VAVDPYDPEWPDAFTALAGGIKTALGSVAVAVDHIGSTSVPGLAAKDCIDIQVQVATLDRDAIVGHFERIGFRERPEPWNRIESTPTGQWPKLVFTPPIGERASNVHVRERGSGTARRNLLFRDFLRANGVARAAWGDFKQRLALIGPDIYQYGQAKAGPTEILMIAAESWASETGSENSMIVELEPKRPIRSQTRTWPLTITRLGRSSSARSSRGSPR
jgi:dephospho-CoA kinase